MGEKGSIHSFWVAANGRSGGVGEPDLLFPYWSFTKTVIAICALKLVERGKLDLDAPLAGEVFSPRQLLAHTAGLPDYGTLADYHRAVASDEVPWHRDEMLRRAMARGPLFPPGTGWSYSNIGYMLARERIERAADATFSEIVGDVLAPLALTTVRLVENRQQFATVCWPAAARYDPRWVYHGCLVGSARDAARLLHGLFSGALIGRDGLRQMLARRLLGGAIAGRPWTDCGYGLGLMSGGMAPLGRAVGHSGGGPFSVNAVYHFPDRTEPITVASFTDGTVEGVAEHEAARLCGALSGPAPGARESRP
jgi:Beta-lactamase class C and other penicillin binding proteins